MLNIIAAIAANGVIGIDGHLPFNQKDDLKWFKAKTQGLTVVMGRKTFVEDLKLKPLPNRENIVLTRTPETLKAEGVFATNDFVPIVARASQEEIFVVGGAEIYKLAIPFADKLFLTRILAEVKGDTYFPEWNPDNWELIFSEYHARDENNEYDFVWEIYKRIKNE